MSLAVKVRGQRGFITRLTFTWWLFVHLLSVAMHRSTSSDTLRLAEMRVISLSCTLGFRMAASETRRSGSRTKSSRSATPPVCARRIFWPVFISPTLA